MQRIDELKEPPVIGMRYLVPCIINRKPDGVVMKMGHIVEQMYLKVWPVINHKHNDIESGQTHYHYHVDFRFVKLDKFNRVLRINDNHNFAPTARYDLEPNEDPKIEYHVLRCERLENMAITDASLLADKSVNRKSIKNNKCPHRGYDLSQEVCDKEGIITCPLHGLRFKNNRVIEI